jgi:hypothetical protein
MTVLTEETQGKTRDMPISERLKTLLVRAGEETNIQKIVVISGGQCAKGTCTKREGSTRHDLGNAADLELWVADRRLAFTDPSGLPIFEKFVSACARLGATGIGAGERYMGPSKIHVGFGARFVWGAGGKAVNAPEWLKAAAKKGWASGTGLEALPFKVVARRGLHLRSGPGIEFDTVSTIAAGTVINIEGYDGATREWAKTDLQGDGLIDGHVHKSFLVSVDLFDTASTEVQDDCAADASSSESN